MARKTTKVTQRNEATQRRALFVRALNLGLDSARVQARADALKHEIARLHDRFKGVPAEVFTDALEAYETLVTVESEAQEYPRSERDADRIEACFPTWWRNLKTVSDWLASIERGEYVGYDPCDYEPASAETSANVTH